MLRSALERTLPKKKDEGAWRKKLSKLRDELWSRIYHTTGSIALAEMLNKREQLDEMHAEAATKWSKK